MIEPMVREEHKHVRISKQDDIKSAMAAIMSCFFNVAVHTITQSLNKAE